MKATGEVPEGKGLIAWFRSLSGAARLAVIITVGLGVAFLAERPDQPSTERPPTTDATTATPGKFEQTWPKSYGDTTCGEWASAMTIDQRRVAAADMLVGAQSRDGGNSLPSDSLIEAFRRDISVACEAEATLAINEIAVGVYLIGADQYRP